MSEFQFVPRILIERLSANFQGQIENSGHFELEIRTQPFRSSKNLVVDVDLRVHNQDLSSLNTFLMPNAGVELQGLMSDGHSRIRARGSSEKASVWATYSGLKVKVHKLYDRS